MSRRIFLLGRPGSGKSSIAEIIRKILLEKGWTALHMFDYEHLQDMFLQETQQNIEKRSFQPSGPDIHRGFDVIDEAVLDKALHDLSDKVLNEEFISPGGEKTILIEFARNNYYHALQQFDRRFLQKAFLLYVNLDVETCIKRIHRRVTVKDKTTFDHFVSDDIMRGYYCEDDWGNDLLRAYQREVGIEDLQTYEVDNSGTYEQLISKVQWIASGILQDGPVTEPMSVLRKAKSMNSEPMGK